MCILCFIASDLTSCLIDKKLCKSWGESRNVLYPTIVKSEENVQYYIYPQLKICGLDFYRMDIFPYFLSVFSNLFEVLLLIDV